MDRWIRHGTCGCTVSITELSFLSDSSLFHLKCFDFFDDIVYVCILYSAYDRAAIKFRGVEADINFSLGDYEDDLKQVGVCQHTHTTTTFLLAPYLQQY